MTIENETLTTFFENWKKYQDLLKQALAPLTAEQLALRAAPELRSIGEIAAHIIGTRIGWFAGFLGEDAQDAAPLDLWDAPGAPAREASELLWGLDRSWKLVADALARWSPADMNKTFGQGSKSTPEGRSRSWVVWHVLEHDLHHGGEISLTLGMHNLQAPDL